MPRKKQIKSQPTTKKDAPCPYPWLDCELSMAGMCCWECDKVMTCKDACQTNYADEPLGCGRFMEGKKRNV